MNVKLKKFLELVAIVVIALIVALSSPFNPVGKGDFTPVQQQILDIAHSVRDGYLAYVELDGHYGPVVYEFYGLGYLITETHVVQFIMEVVILLATVLFMFKTAKLYTSDLFALVATALLAIFEWGALTHAGAEELMFFVLTLTVYHVARQLKAGYLSHHTYLLAVDLGLVCFIQPGYVWLWVALILMFAVKFKVDGVDGKHYRSFWMSMPEGIITVLAPVILYLVYFKNASAFFDKVFVYNMSNIDFSSVGEGLKIICGSPWIAFVPLLVVLIIIKAVGGEKIDDLCIYLGVVVFAIFIFAIQGEKVDSVLQLSKALYIVPLAGLFSLCDKALGWKVAEGDD
ncbi:hypothetical protein SAMN04487830_11533 [Pseudobutyrivibrio sp. OR37]|uniref:hypothetical protein n=1 Tax=Pseudobutyrivibrio sp. OR37 TaxID=1798186 RepID=UPI0008DFA13F|nr:hypothetical protein [Pseudobutyrivibrio sp. OR37]SFH97616.1 hypothetical protein SAMN04487830_11533 [Pseudobutyrivibrio sp. OR37]